MQEGLMQVIPLEQQIILIGGLIALILSALGGAGYLFRLWFLQKLKDSEIKMQSRFDADKAKIEIDRLKIQNQLDETQNNRHINTMWFSELAESRKEDNHRFALMQEAFRTQNENHAKQTQDTTEVYRGIQANTAATLELLKLHSESDDMMRIKQEKLISQNDNTHGKLIDLASSLDAVIMQVNSIAENRTSDRKILEDITGALVLIQSGIKRLEEIPKAVFDETIPMPDLSNGLKDLKEIGKDFSRKSED